MSFPVVKIPNGILQGDVRTNIDGEEFLSFLGIPYAKPPVGDLRFKAPIPIDSWSGVRDATKEGDCCYSRNDITNGIEGSEDCLYLNVFTKELPGEGRTPKPVMVWIHGGGYVFGSSRTFIYGPEFLLTKDIVLVSINYRLGVLGFLSLKDPSVGIPGNAGLKDQVLALKWVQENIRYFNGDPNNVTIFGESAGSASVHFLILSPAAKGLFHKAILQSGSALNTWATSNQPHKNITDHLGYDTKSDAEIYEVLRTTAVEKLFEVQEKLDGTFKPSEDRLIGVVKEYPNETAFLTKNVIDIIRSGDYNQVPMFFGYTTREGMFVESIKALRVLDGSYYDEKLKLEENVPWQLGFPKDSEKFLEICGILKDFYFKNGDEMDNWLILFTDSYFLAGIMASIRNHILTNQKPIYLYRVSLETSLNYWKNVHKLNHLPGTCHADELGYLFKNILTPEFKPGSLEDISVRRFVTIWANFAKYSNPTPDHELGVVLKPVKDEQLNFLDIGSELSLQVNPEPERIAIWEGIFRSSPNTSNFL